MRPYRQVEIPAMASRLPSFKGLQAASAASSRSKRANKRCDTLPEIMLRRELWHMDLRYRKNVAALPGQPDIVFARSKVVVFCDGDFWHGRDWPSRRAKLSQGTNAAYWLAKIEANIARDAEYTSQLEQAGWKVVRLWETDIKRDPHIAACRLRDIVCARCCPQHAARGYHWSG